MKEIKVDLHDIYSEGHKLEQALHGIMRDAVEKKARTVEIIPGKGSGQLKKHVIRFLEKNYKNAYNRIEKDDKNWGRIFVHMKRQE
jgi:DNA-nicking Smr family endonuclease